MSVQVYLKDIQLPRSARTYSIILSNKYKLLMSINRPKAFNQKEYSLEEFLNKFSKDNVQLEVDRLFHSLLVKPSQRVYTYHKTDFVSPFKCGDLVHFNKVYTNGLILNKVFPCQSVKFRKRGNPTLVDTDGKEYNLNYCSLLISSSLVFI